VHLLGKYYDNITPFGTGGQPMQIYYLHRKGYSGGDASAIVLIRYFAQMFAWLLVGVALLSTHVNTLSALSDASRVLILTAGWIGLFANMLIPLFVMSFVAFPKFSYKLTSGIIGIGVKLHLVKNREKAMGSALKIVSDFRIAFSIMIKKPVHLVALILLCVIETCASFALPFFAMGMLAHDEITLNVQTFFAVMALNAYATFAVSVIPTPGNSGVAESASLIAFSVFLETVGVWVVFTWRFVVYYIYILIGIGITIFEVIRKFVRAHLAKKRNALTAGETQGNHQANADVDNLEVTAENQVEKE
jgi:hypothetical protein